MCIIGSETNILHKKHFSGIKKHDDAPEFYCEKEVCMSQSVQKSCFKL